METNVFDVAKYILEKMGKMSTWKLQKLCYYSQAWTLAWDGEPLFDEDFEAWSNGPVCRVLFDKHKGRFMIDACDLDTGDSGKLNMNQKGNIDIVIRDYGPMEAYALREQTHGEAPWRDTRGSLPDGAPSNAIIPKAVMGEYYAGL